MAKRLIGKILGTDGVVDAVKETTDKLLDQRYTKEERARDSIRVLEMHEASRNASEELDSENLKFALDFLEREREDAEKSVQRAREHEIAMQGNGSFLSANAPMIIGLLVIIFGFSILLVILFAKPPIEDRLSERVIGLVEYLLIATVSYFVGSSVSSSRKNDIIERMKKPG
jgi:hypothetical protein